MDNDNFTKPVCLLVDDDPEDLLIEGYWLDKLGMKVVSASTVAQARQLLIANLDIAIAFVDVKLVGSAGNGFSVVRHLEQCVPWVPIVMVTGYRDPQPLAELFQLEAVSIAFKPVAKETFERLLRQRRII